MFSLKTILFVWLSWNVVKSENVESDGGGPVYPSSCKGLADGTHSLKLLEGDEYPVVELECSNGYAILDITKDSKISQYFSSFEMWHTYIAGPSNNDPTTWKNWYLPSQYGTLDTSFLVSNECDVCDETDTATNELGTDTTTWMTGNVFGCYWLLKGIHTCDMDDDTYECYKCNNVFVQTSLDTYIANNFVGTCMKLLRNSDDEVATSHDQCTAYHENSYKPTLLTNGKTCICVKPGDETQYYKDTQTLETLDNTDEEEDAASVVNDGNYDSEEGVYKLYQKDFLYGTYRIVQSGTYKIMEDIVFDFNAPEEETADGSYDHSAWWPNEDQRELYSGAGIETGTSWRDEYFMGFFAGIAIETDDVVIDLNGKTLKQSYNYYIQQRFFSIIELSNQPFAPGQGIGMFGSNPVKISNVKISNGVLGLSSHHGIHGNKVTNVEINDLVIKNFETHGIQINGFNNLAIRNVEIMESSRISYLKSNYFHARLLLPRLKYVLNENEENNEEHKNSVQFRSRADSIYLGDIITTLENELNMVFAYLTDRENFIDNELPNVIMKDSKKMEEWNEAKELFINENGIPYGSTLYGMFLNAEGANVFTVSQSAIDDIPGISDKLVLENVKIHDLAHQLEETVRFHSQHTFLVNPFNAVIEVRNLFSDINDFDSAEYIGNTLTDAYFGLNAMTSNWGILGMQHFSDATDNSGLVGWVLGNNQLSNDRSILGMGCNSDSMTHNSKGIFGLRIEGATNVEISNVEVYNLHDSTPLGESEACGDYDAYDAGNGGHFSQKAPTQVGFTGNSVQAVHLTSVEVTKFSNINVRNIQSDYGLSYGVAIWPTAQVDITGEINVKNIKAGTKLSKNALSYMDRPNKAPEACGIRIYWLYDYAVPKLTMSDDVDVSKDINTQCVYGHVSCFDFGGYSGTTLGKYETHCEATGEFERDFIVYDTKKDRQVRGISLEESQQLFAFTTADTDGSSFVKKFNGITVSNSKHSSNGNNTMFMVGSFVIVCAICAVSYIIYSRSTTATAVAHNTSKMVTETVKENVEESDEESSQLLTNYGTV